jgi:hypothetical protein
MLTTFFLVMYLFKNIDNVIEILNNNKNKGSIWKYTMFFLNKFYMTFRTFFHEVRRVLFFSKNLYIRGLLREYYYLRCVEK